MTGPPIDSAPEGAPTEEEVEARLRRRMRQAAVIYAALWLLGLAAAYAACGR